MSCQSSENVIKENEEKKEDQEPGSISEIYHFSADEIFLSAVADSEASSCSSISSTANRTNV